MASCILKHKRITLRHHCIGTVAMSISNAALGRVILAVGLCAGPAFPQQSQQQPAEDLPAPIKVDVNVVNILASVRDKRGALVSNLTKDDFVIEENGKPQTIKYFARETDLPLTIGLLVDVSASQANLIDVERRAASDFFAEVLRKKDMAFLISFGEDAELLQDYTNSVRFLEQGLNDLHVKSSVSGLHPGPVPTIDQPAGTVLYDAVYLAAQEKLRREVGRKVIVLITDGVDQGSKVRLDSAIEEAQKSDAVVYGIYYYDPSAYGGGFIHAPQRFRAAQNGRADRRPHLQSGPQAFALRCLQRAAGRDAQPVRHRIQSCRRQQGRLLPQGGSAHSGQGPEGPGPQRLLRHQARVTSLPRIWK